jgi:hypothetical protein
LAATRSGALDEPAKLAAEIDRMIADPRFDRFVSRFLEQWLDLRKLDDTQPDRRMYPEYRHILRASMVEESRAFFKVNQGEVVGSFRRLGTQHGDRVNGGAPTSLYPFQTITCHRFGKTRIKNMATAFCAALDHEFTGDQEGQVFLFRKACMHGVRVGGLK